MASGTRRDPQLLLFTLALLAPGALLASVPGRAARARFSRPARPSPPQPADGRRRPRPSDVRDYVLGIVEHDVRELGFTIMSECSRCAGAIQRVASDEAERALGFGRITLHPLLAYSGPTLGRPRSAASGADGAAITGADAAADLGDDGQLTAGERISQIAAAQSVRFSNLIDSYVHYRLPLALWWMCRSAQPFEPLLAPLAPALARQLKGGDVSAGSSEALALSSFERGNLQEALLHMRPQIVAKLRHASFHEPAALATFVAVALRLVLLVPLLQLTLLLGSPAAPLRQRLTRLVMREAHHVSERCNRVERRRSLPPPPLPRKLRRCSWGERLRAVGVAAVVRSACALEKLAAPTPAHSR